MLLKVMESNGILKVWRKNDEPTQATEFNLSVAKLTFGTNHGLILTTDGCIYGFGSSTDGQLGNGESDSFQKNPILINIPHCDSHELCKSCSVTDIACGPNHSACVLQNGFVYMWGASEHGQCGMEQSVVPMPQQIGIYDSMSKVPTQHKCSLHLADREDYLVPIIQISCGKEHTVALSKLHEVWVWGTGSAQLGLLNIEWSYKPLKVSFLESKKVLSVSCGFNHTAIIIQKNSLHKPKDDSTKCIKCEIEKIVNPGNCISYNKKTCPFGLSIDSPNQTNASFSFSSSHCNGESSKTSLDSIRSDLRDKNSLKNDSECETEQHDLSSIKIEVEDTEFNGKETISRNSLTSFIDKDSATAFFNKSFNSLESKTESKSMKKYLLANTNDAVTEICTAVSEKLETLVHMKAPALNEECFVENDFVFVSEEMKLENEFEDLESSALRSSSVRMLQKPNILEKPADKNISRSMDRLFLDNKHRFRLSSLRKDKKNIPSEDLYLHKLPNFSKEGVETEVWTWGKGRYGQLGHCDMLERIQPCVVQVLSSKNVVKVIAAANHTIAMTNDCQIFSWGANDYGQLGHSAILSSVCSPCRIQISDLALIWDIASNNSSIMFLADFPNSSTDLFQCGGGKSRHEDPNQDGLIVPKKLELMNNDFDYSCIFAGGDFCCCMNGSVYDECAKLIHNFASSEKQFHFYMRVVSDEIFKMLLKEDIMKEDTNVVITLKMFISAHSEFCDLVAINCFDLLKLLQKNRQTLSNGDILNIYMFEDIDNYQDLLLHYLKTYCDFVSISSYLQIVKTSPLIFYQKRVIIDELYKLASGRDDSPDLGFALNFLWCLPFKRIAQYIQLVSQLKEQFFKETSEYYFLGQVIKLYSELESKVTSQMKSAEETAKFWESCPSKIATALKDPQRRYIKDSKTDALVWSGSSRFYSYWFILFNDVFIHSQYSSLQAYYLSTIWIEVLPDTETCLNSFTMKMPEDTLTLSCPTSALKTEWVCTLNERIKNSLSKSDNKSDHKLNPPLIRFATHNFLKNPNYKDANYSGMWLFGALHGEGLMKWPNGKKYMGKFKQNEKNGHGILSIPSDLSSDKYTVYEGEWKNDKLNGLCTVKYPNGDLYEGYFKDDQRHGHGVLKKGQFLSTAASVYVGGWFKNMRHGYGMNEDVMAGEKFMGMWENDERHGNGVIVTIDGIYYEGSFYRNKMQGYGIVIFEDDTNYEGDLSGHGIFSGKGALNLSNGDRIEGSFNGKWNDEVKINGTFQKSCSSNPEPKDKLPKSFGKLCVKADNKWGSIFKQCCEILNIVDPTYDYDAQVTTKAWENVAIIVTTWKKILSQKNSKKLKQIDVNIRDLDTIPKQSSLTDSSPLLLEDYEEIKSYLSKAFNCIYHPIGQLVDQLTDVFRVTYVGVGAHSKLLSQAVDEVWSYIVRIYDIIQVLFPVLPKTDQSPKMVLSKNDPISPEMVDYDNIDCEFVSPLSFVLPMMLPRIYSPLFMLYALHNEIYDNKYWERLLKWNKQTDVTLLNFLGAEQKFWLTDLEMLSDKYQNNATNKPSLFGECIETLQRLSTTFSPCEKLSIIHQTFQSITKVVEQHLGKSVLWTMDELFPVFQFTVVRARIRHLGSEIHFIENFMEKRFENGELGIMFTTLQACYFQIQNEKIVNW